MTIMVLLFCIILAIGTGAGVLALVSPLLLGFGILVMVNAVWLGQTGKMASAPWNAVTVAASIVASCALLLDVVSEEVDMGPLPFVIILVYGAIVIVAALIAAAISRRRRSAAAETAEETPRDDTKESAVSSPPQVADWKLQEQWEDYPVPNYDAIHTYYRVIFDDSGRSYYYRTRNPDIQVGDAVYAPVGYQYEKNVGRVVSREDYLGHDAPYPLGKTKYIIGKVE